MRKVEAGARPLGWVAVIHARRAVLELDLVVGAAAEALGVRLKQQLRLLGCLLSCRLAAGATVPLRPVEDLATRPRGAQPKGAGLAVGRVVETGLTVQVVPRAVVDAAHPGLGSAAAGAPCWRAVRACGPPVSSVTNPWQTTTKQ